MRFSAVLVGVVAFLMLAGPFSVSRALANDVDTCDNGNAAGDERIAACTGLINSGRFKGPNLAGITYNRGNAYRVKGDYDHAIADYDEAIRLDPKDPDAYNNRGLAYRKKGDTQWKRAMDLMRLQGERVYQGEGVFNVVMPNMFAGSVLDLEENTAYQVRLRMSDPDGGQATRIVTVAQPRKWQLDGEDRALAHARGHGDRPAHEPDERIAIETLVRAAKIYAHALYELAR